MKVWTSRDSRGLRDVLGWHDRGGVPMGLGKAMAKNMGPGERWARVGLGVAFIVLAGLLPGPATAWLLALLGLGLLVTAWRRH